jgi:hypothetical protein
VFEFGAELSFKAFSTWQDNQGFIWRHVVEPYTDITLIPEPNLLPEQIYQFDEVDEIEESNTVRFGVEIGGSIKQIILKLLLENYCILIYMQILI